MQIPARGPTGLSEINSLYPMARMVNTKHPTSKNPCFSEAFKVPWTQETYTEAISQEVIEDKIQRCSYNDLFVPLILNIHN